MSHKPRKQEFDRKRQPVEFDDEAYENLMQCINSGQVSAAQLVQHYEAGEIKANQGVNDGRKTEN